jgi:hypothetical protein
MVGRAAPVLGVRVGARQLAFAALAAALGAYYAWSESLWSASVNWDLVFLCFVLLPAVFGLVWLVLPMWRSRAAGVAGLLFAVLAAALTLVNEDVIANFAKLGATTFIAFWFLSFFETASWVALVAVVIPWVDAWSVWRGPTRDIVANRQDVFGTLSIAFPVPGEREAANLGLPDLLFFALFLSASVRFRLRPALTWLLLTASFGTTMALAVGFGAEGLPALPLLSAAFFLANGDLIWRRARAAAAAPSPPREVDTKS